MALQPYVSMPGRMLRYAYLAFCALVFVFLIAPILVMIPLSFNAEPYFTFTKGMLSFDPAAYSLRWYADLFGNPQWLHSIKNSLFIGLMATALSTVLGTLAALGLSRRVMPCRKVIMAVLISPMIVPVIISAAGMFFFFARLGLVQTHLGIILAHAVLGTPFVVITVTATLVGFDRDLMRAAAGLGAGPVRTFFEVTFPLIRPGIISGALFAFVTSFDEVVAVLFLGGIEQQTVPRQMWAGIREQISPTILSVATLLITFSVLLLLTLEILRRRIEKQRGSQVGT